MGQNRTDGRRTRPNLQNRKGSPQTYQSSLKFEFKPAFDRSIKALPIEDGSEIKKVCLDFIDLLEKRIHLPSGIGLKRLKDDYWEIRKGLRSRILFLWKGDKIIFVMAGDHNEIKNFLRKS